MGVFPQSVRGMDWYSKVHRCLPGSFPGTQVKSAVGTRLEGLLLTGNPASASWPRGVAQGYFGRPFTGQSVRLGGNNAGCGSRYASSPPPEMHNTLFPGVLGLLTHLESATWVPFCRFCYLPVASCWCLGVPSTTTTLLSTTGPSWSEITDPIPSYGATTSTPQQGAPGAAPPGLTTPGAGSIWNPPYPDFPTLLQLQGNLPPPRPPAGRGATLDTQLRAVQERRRMQDARYTLPWPWS